MTKRDQILTALNFLIIIFCSQTYAQNTITKEILWTTDWSPNGKYIAVGGNVDTLKIYSEGNLKLYKSFPIKKTITRIKWHPTANIVAVATQNSEDKTTLINLDNNEKIELGGVSSEGARGIDWNYTGDFLAVADNEGQVRWPNFRGQ